MQEENIIFDDSEPEDAPVDAPEVDVPEPAEPAQETEQEPEQETDPEVEPVKAEKKAVPEFTPEQQEVFNEAIARKVAKQREAERKAEELEQQARQYQEELNRLKQPQRPQIPDYPDRYDDNFEQNLQRYNQAVRDQMQYDMSVQHQQYTAEQERQQQAQKRQEEIQSLVESYSGRAKIQGIKAEELKAAGEKVAMYGINDEVARYILDDDLGPSITTYLAKNPLELDAINVLSPLRAAAYIESTIKPKSKKAPVNPPPEPIETLRGSGAPEGDSRLKGVKFE